MQIYSYVSVNNKGLTEGIVFVYTRIITLMNNLKLRTKLFLSFGCVVLIPVLIVGVFLTSELQNMALDNALEQITANVDRVKKNRRDAECPARYRLPAVQ